MLERFIEQYSESAFHFAYRLCGNMAEAQELVQEAFFRAMKNWDSYDPGQPFESWYQAILRNIHADWVKSPERQRMLSLDFPDPAEGGAALAENLPDLGEEAALARLERQETSSKVQAALAAISPIHGAILTLCDAQGLGYEEIADVLGIPLGTVRSRINRARAAFKAKVLEVMAAEEVNYAVS